MAIQSVIFSYMMLMAFVTTQQLFFAACDGTGGRIGVNYGTLGDNLPAPANTVNLFKNKGIKYVRMYDPNHGILDALRGSTDIQVSIGMLNNDITRVANSQSAATEWVTTNILPYKDSVNFAFVTLGNEVIPSQFAHDIAQGIRNIKSALVSIGLPGIKVSTTTLFNVQSSFPPSGGKFAPDVAEILKDVSHALRENQAPLLVSVYPYYSFDPNAFSLEFATFSAKDPKMDGKLAYYNLFEAMLDSYYTALANIGAGDINIVIAESGWPTAGKGNITSVEIAQTYNTNLIKRVKSGSGTPGRPGWPLDVFIFDLFDENQKPAGGPEQHWGIFHPDMTPKYPLEF